MTEHPSTAQPVTIPPPGTYRLDPERTIIRTRTKAMFGMQTVKGTFRLLDGDVRIVEDPAQSTVQATIDATSFTSGLGQRDRDVVSSALLDAQTFPRITFASTSVREDGTGWLAQGRVEAHGTPDSVDMRVTGAEVEGSTVRFRATASLDRTRFGVIGKKRLVGQITDVTIEATAVRE